MRKSPNTAILSLSLFLGLSAFGSSEDTSLRELCRKNISGQYLSTYDRVYNAKNQLTHYNKKEKEILKYISKNQADYKKKKQATNTKEYNANLINKRDHAKVKLDTSIGQLKDLKNLKSKASFDLEDYSKKLSDLEKKIKTIFIIQKISEKKHKAYPLSIKYKSTCPKYRFMCKLPRQDIPPLKNLIKELDDSQSCQRYISFSHTQLN